MNTEPYIRHKIKHDVYGEELENAISFYLTDEMGLDFGEFSLTRVTQNGPDGRIFPDTAIEATTRTSDISTKFEDDVEKVAEDEAFDSLLFFTTHPAEAVESKRKALSKEHGLDIDVVGRDELVTCVLEIQEPLGSDVDKDAAFKQVFKRD